MPRWSIPGTNPNGLQFVYTYPFNNGFLTTSGLDFIADYAMDFWNGNLAWHLAGQLQRRGNPIGVRRHDGDRHAGII